MKRPPDATTGIFVQTIRVAKSHGRFRRGWYVRAGFSKNLAHDSAAPGESFKKNAAIARVYFIEDVKASGLGRVAREIAKLGGDERRMPNGETVWFFRTYPCPDVLSPLRKIDIRGFLKNIQNYLKIPDPDPTALRNPFRQLVSCIISLRTKDEVTYPAAERLFGKADTPDGLLKLGAREIARTIYPAGFYATKAKSLVKIARIVVGQYEGRVPDTIEELVKLPGVGRKTANLVLAKGFFVPAICVDTHVHRIMNRCGFVDTDEPDQTELMLRARLPKDLWIIINDLLVPFGQRVCRPIGPRCDACPVAGECLRLDPGIGGRMQTARAGRA